MAHATFVKKAQKNIYENGKYVKYTSKKGKREGQELSKLDRTIPKDENDKIFIAAGESYYWWAFKNGGKHFSKERPKPSQLTQSNYLSQLYEIQERMDEIKVESPEDLESVLDDLKSDLENLKDETQGSLDNMPEGLQSGPTGELLQERIDALDNAISELEGIDCSDYEEPDLETYISEMDEDIEADGYEAPTEESPEYIEWKEDKFNEWADEKISEIQGVSLE